MTSHKQFCTVVQMYWRILTLAAVVVSVNGHGRLAGPPSRASMWRFGYSTSPNYDDDGVNCGGFYHQYSICGGKCGICGDPCDMSEPKTHEIGGRYGQGIIVADYEAGQIFTATIVITAYHKGYWVLKICTDPYNNDQECFDEHPVELAEGGTRYYPPHGGEFQVDYRLPEELSCDHCVLQWKYIAGNNWGVCANGTQGLGCGNQETFGACADISIRRIKYAPVETGSLPVALLDSLEAQGLLDLIHIATINSYRKHKDTNKNPKKKTRRKPRNNKKSSKRKKVYWKI